MNGADGLAALYSDIEKQECKTVVKFFDLFFNRPCNHSSCKTTHTKTTQKTHALCVRQTTNFLNGEHFVK